MCNNITHAGRLTRRRQMKTREQRQFLGGERVSVGGGSGGHSGVRKGEEVATGPYESATP